MGLLGLLPVKILVIGGAGYIGAHVVNLLQRRGAQVAVVDDLSYGRADRVGPAEFIRFDVSADGAVPRLVDVLDGAQAVIHFAARKQVGESMAKPAWYYQQNVNGLANVIAAMEQASVNRLVFSSSAAVYGMPDVPTVPEDIDLRPINPYGETKLIGEWLCRDAERAWGLRSVCLRYFNVAGAGSPTLGDPAVLNLIPMVFDCLWRGAHPKLFGQDYPTTDGTCVRDYIHVADLADAHVAALNYLDRAERPHQAFNVGTGQGSSVSEVIAEIGRVSGLDATPDVEARRPGDPPYLVGNIDRISSVLDWHARYGLSEIVTSAWAAWQHDHVS